MGREHALLLLANPPQSTRLEDLRLAFYPPLAAAVDRLTHLPTRATNEILLDIALPVTRVVSEASSPDELGTRCSNILTAMYQLLEDIFAQSQLPSCHGRLDARILLVHESTPDADNVLLTLPLAIQDFHAFATSGRQWTRLFRVDSLQGDEMYRKLRNEAHFSIRTELHERAERLPSGIQMFTPRAAASPKTTKTVAAAALDPEKDPRSVTVDLDGPTLDFAAKSQLTIGLMALPRQAGKGLGSGERMPSGSFHVVVHGGEQTREAVRRFLLGMLCPESGDGIQGSGSGVTLANELDEVAPPNCKGLELFLNDGTQLTISSPEDVLHDQECNQAPSPYLVPIVNSLVITTPC